jgi:hypothetical protein
MPGNGRAFRGFRARLDVAPLVLTGPVVDGVLDWVTRVSLRNIWGVAEVP